MDVASPIESRIAGEQIASGTRFRFTARKSTTLATRFTRDWLGANANRENTSRGSSATSAAVEVGVDLGGARNVSRARYRCPHHPSVTGEDRAS